MTLDSNGNNFLNELGSPGVASIANVALNSSSPCNGAGSVGGIDADFFSFPVEVLKLNDPWNFGKQGIITADANVLAGMKMGPALPDQNLPCFHHLTAIAFNSQAFADAIAPV